MPVATQRLRRRQPPEQTRRQILDAAMELLSDGSYRELSVDAIMRRTGHTRTLFYRHFADIPAVILALIQDLGSELMAVADEWAHSESIGPAEARRRLETFVEFHYRNAAAYRAVIEAAHHDDAVEGAYAAMVERFVTLTAEAIEARIATDTLDPLDAPEVARALVHMLNGYLSDPGRTDDFARGLETVWTIWTRTLFPGMSGETASVRAGRA